MSENTEYDHKETKQLLETKRPGFGGDVWVSHMPSVQIWGPEFGP